MMRKELIAEAERELRESILSKKLIFSRGDPIPEGLEELWKEDYSNSKVL